MKLRKFWAIMLVIAILLNSMPMAAATTEPTETTTPTVTTKPTATTTTKPTAAPCTHENTKQEEYSDTMGYEQVDELNHKVFIRMTVRTVCTACSSIIEENTSYKEPEEEHVFDETLHQCMMCGCVDAEAETSSCSHANTTTDENGDVWDHAELDEENHNTYERHYKTVTCNDCGMIVSHDIEFVWTPYPHIINDVTNECEVCGYVVSVKPTASVGPTVTTVPICLHMNTYTTEINKNYVYKAYDEWRHSTFADRYEELKCSDCSEVLSSRLLQEQAELGFDLGHYGSHYFVDGVCETCDYSNVCPHEERITNEYYLNDEVVESTDTTHTIVGDRYRYSHCNTCGETFEKTLIEAAVSRTEDHDWVRNPEDRWCDRCGVVKECAHEKTETVKVVADGVGACEYESVNDKYHIVRKFYYGGTRCLGCGYVFEMVQLDEIADEQLAEHDFCWDGQYVSGCMRCDYEIICSHENGVVTEFGWSSAGGTDIWDERYHEDNGTVLKMQNCVDCGVSLSVENYQYIYRLFEHEFDETGKCDCGYYCGHSLIESTIDLINEKATSFDASGHTITGQQVEKKSCLCGKNTSESVVNEAYSETKEHSFVDGQCEVCGYTEVEATAKPTAVPTSAPTAVPTAKPTVTPSAEPTAVPTVVSTATPTAQPTPIPTAELTIRPTERPTPIPTVEPTIEPTAEPTAVPTAEPTVVPTATPVPTVRPTVSAPVIEAEKVENKPIEVFTEEVIQNIESEIEGEYEVIVPVEPLKEVIGEETYAKVEQLKPEEKIIVLLAALGELDEKLSQNSLMDNKGLILSEETEAVVKDVTKTMRQMNEKEENAFAEMIAEYFPSQEVEVEGKEYVYYLIPMKIVTEEGVEIRHYAFCFDKKQKTWLFTLVEPGEEIIDVLEEDKDDEKKNKK